MLDVNPFAALSASVEPWIMQAFVGLMIALTVAGTLYDMAHKRSAEYFLGSLRTASRRGRAVGAAEKASLAAQTLAVEVLTAGEFCNVRRRAAHLLTMYGFLAYAAATVGMVFWYADGDVETPSILPLLWHVGALAVVAGGAWFWFFIRVDVSAEGHSPLRIVRADLFVLALTASCALAVLWSYLQQSGSDGSELILGLYLLANMVLFGTVGWSKFPHMFYKPAAAFQKRVEEARGTRSNLPAPAEKPATFGSARRAPHHY